MCSAEQSLTHNGENHILPATVEYALCGLKKKKDQSCYKSPTRLIDVNWGYSASMIPPNQNDLLSERNEGLRETHFLDVAMLSSLLNHDLVRML